MTDELKISIERLYSTFSRYPLHSKDLQLLKDDDISRYAFKAMTTWGDVNDFKHHLPRILELLSTADLRVDTFVVLGKLDYANWAMWPDDEKNTIRMFLLAWWRDMVENRYLDKQAFVDIYKHIGSIEPLLDRWNIVYTNKTFENYIDFLYDDFNNLKNNRKPFESLQENSRKKLLQWLTDEKKLIEKGFFHFQHIDPTFAQKISNTLYMIEHS